jgi:hypothetical protein
MGKSQGGGQDRRNRDARITRNAARFGGAIQPGLDFGTYSLRARPDVSRCDEFGAISAVGAHASV